MYIGGMIVMIVNLLLIIRPNEGVHKSNLMFSYGFYFQYYFLLP